MRKRNLKVTSLMLIVVMLLNFLPASATNVSATDAQTTPSVSTVPNPDYVEPGSVRELESRREENVKHFLLPDNTVQAVVYADAVHRKDADGNWQDISNDLSLTEYKGVKFYTTADERVVFAEKFAPNAQLWQLSENGYTVAMGVVSNQLSADATVTPIGGVTVTNAPVQRSATTWHSVEEARVVDNTASIVYSNIKANTDLEYIMIGNDIKENIVVKTRSNSYTYQFQLTLTGLTAILNEDGSISLTDSATQQQQYIIPAPYMVDAAGEYSNEVTYSLNQAGEGQYTLTVTADSTWINADDRAFPVKIDPTITRITSFDTYIDSNHPNQNYGGSETMWLADHTVALFQMYLPTLPTGATLTEANFNVFYYYYNSVTTGAIYAGAYRVEQLWAEYTHTWNQANQYANLGISSTLLTLGLFSGEVGAYASSPVKETFNITSTVQAWYNGTPNHGLAIRFFHGTNSSVVLYSNESQSAYRPYFTLTYAEQRLADGVYSLQNVGTNLYLDVRGSGYTAGTVVQQYSAAAAGYERNQLFKITFLETVGGDNYYSVRSMTNSGLGLSAALTTGVGDVILDTMSTADVYNNDAGETMWAISPQGTSYTLKNGDSIAGGYLTAPNGYVGTQMRTAQGVTNNSKWNLIPYTGPTLQGAFATNFQSEMTVGSQMTINAVMYSTEIGVNGPVTFSMCGVDGQPTTKALIGSDSGFVSVAEPGTVFVTLNFMEAPWGYQYELGIKTSTCKTVVLDLLYDQTYLLRYPDAPNRIQDHFYALRELYINEFDIWVRNTAPSVFSCYACENGHSNSVAACTCKGNSHCADSQIGATGEAGMSDFHHTNLTNILRRVELPTLTENLRVVFIGHEICLAGATAADHRSNPTLGRAYWDLGLMVVVNPYGLENERKTFVHEFNHFYMVEDHYGIGGVPSTNEKNAEIGYDLYNSGCIHGEDKENSEIRDNLVICGGCKAVIQSNREKYSHG